MRYLLIALALISSIAAADPLIERACAGDAAAVQSLRLTGPSGLLAVGAAYDAVAAPDAVVWDRVFDAVAAQRHARYSRLYWYTDLESAKAAAATSGKPIVSLRLLGTLTDELSCANSRFFRALLYADPIISAWLREQVILHWSSERPVPRVTIDFGDGRTMDTTLTGNSAHYILDAEGRPLDVIPGLLAPQPFLEALRSAVELHRRLAADPAPFIAVRHAWHVHQLSAIDAARTASGIAFPKPIQARRKPEAAQALPIAVGKSLVEMPVLDAITLQKSAGQPIFIAAGVAPTWTEIGYHWQGVCQLPDTTLALLRTLYAFPIERFGTAVEASPLQRLEISLAADTARNTWDLHRTIHQWFVNHEVTDFISLNQRLYGELFLTPASDPWLGLRSTTFDGIARGSAR